jgi:hypothetical protein
MTVEEVAARLRQKLVEAYGAEEGVLADGSTARRLD